MGTVSPIAYSTPTRSLTFSWFVAMSQGHSVSSLSQSQSALAAKRKGNAVADKDNAAKKRRGKLDTKDDTEYNTVKTRGDKLDIEDDTKYDDEFFLSQMHLLEKRSGSKGGWLS